MYILLEMAKLRAVPLCLPNNCIWDEKTGEYSKNAEERKTLYVVDAALQKLQSIKGKNKINIKTCFPCVYPHQKYSSLPD